MEGDVFPLIKLFSVDGNLLDRHLSCNQLRETNPVVKGIGLPCEDVDFTFWVFFSDPDRRPCACHSVSNDEILFHLQPPLNWNVESREWRVVLKKSALC